MAWHRELTLGDHELRLALSPTGSFDRRAGRAPTGRDIVRLGDRHVIVALRHVMVALRHRGWNDLSESERWDRIHGYRG
jgi:hypothetical protein